MGLTADQEKSAQEYNKKYVGQRWAPADVLDDELQRLPVESPEFAQRVAAIQAEEEGYVDGKLGPRTVQALLEKRVELDFLAEDGGALDLGWWTQGAPWPEAAAIADVPEPLADESLDAYLDRNGCPHWSAFELTRLSRWGRNVEPYRGDFRHIIPTVRLAEILRHELGNKPLLTASGYRPRRYNKAVSGAKNSQHMSFRALHLALDEEPRSSVDQQRRLYEVAARLFVAYGAALAMGLGFYKPERGTHVSIDTGSSLRFWEGASVPDVVAQLGLTMPTAAPTPA